MAIERIGNLTRIQSNVNSDSQSISVPNDATLIVVGVSGYSGAGYFANGSITLNGSALTELAADSNGSYTQGLLGYLVNPSTGTQTLAWDWDGTGAPAAGVILVYGFYKGVDTASLVRDSYSLQQAYAATIQTDTMTASDGDYAIAWVGGYGSSATFSWTNATKVADFDVASGYNTTLGTWAEATLSGNTQITCTGNIDMCIMALVLKPAAAGGTSILRQMIAHSE